MGKYKFYMELLSDFINLKNENYIIHMAKKDFIVVVSDRDPEPDASERQLKELINGRKPKNKYERELVKQLEEMKKKGQVPYMPSN